MIRNAAKIEKKNFNNVFGLWIRVTIIKSITNWLGVVNSKKKRQENISLTKLKKEIQFHSFQNLLKKSALCAETQFK